MLNLFRREPLLVSFAVRVVVYVLGTYFALRVDPEASEMLTTALIAVLGVDAASTARDRSVVTPVADPRLPDDPRLDP